MAISLNINGKSHSVNSDPDTPLLWVILEGLDVRDQGWVCCGGWAHDVPSQSGRWIPSTISRFWVSLMPPE